MTFFTAEDFEKMQYWFPQTLAKHCNEKLQREAKVVYICDKEIKTLHFAQPVDATHTGILMCIEPLEKPKCEHKRLSHERGSDYYECTRCHQKLIPTGWAVVDEQR